MLCNKGKNDLHLKRSCSCQNKKIYGIYVSGRIFRCISSINRIRCFQTMPEVNGNNAEGLTKRKGSAREERSTRASPADRPSAQRRRRGRSRHTHSTDRANLCQQDTIAGVPPYRLEKPQNPATAEASATAQHCQRGGAMTACVEVATGNGGACRMDRQISLETKPSVS